MVQFCLTKDSRKINWATPWLMMKDLKCMAILMCILSIHSPLFSSLQFSENSFIGYLED